MYRQTSYRNQTSSSFLPSETHAPVTSSLNRFKNHPDYSGTSHWNNERGAPARAGFGSYDRQQNYNNDQYQNYNYNNDYNNTWYQSQYGVTGSTYGNNHYNRSYNHRSSFYTNKSATPESQHQSSWGRPANSEQYSTNNSALVRKNWPAQTPNSNFINHYSDNKKPVAPAPKNNFRQLGVSKSFGSTWQKPSSSSVSSTSVVR